MSMNVGERRRFKMNEAVTVYAAIRIMRTAWNLVSKNVVSKRWIFFDIVSYDQTHMLTDASEEDKKNYIFW